MNQYILFFFSIISTKLLEFDHQIFADEGQDIPDKCSKEILEIYLEPNPNFSENAKAPTPY